jgi:uncharacterized protein with HEPN domain
LPSGKRIRWFEDVLENIARIERFTAGFDFRRFVTDERASFAVLHALLIIGEAARRLGSAAERLLTASPGAISAALATSCVTSMPESI